MTKIVSKNVVPYVHIACITTCCSKTAKNAYKSRIKTLYKRLKQLLKPFVPLQYTHTVFLQKRLKTAFKAFKRLYILYCVLLYEFHT